MVDYRLLSPKRRLQIVTLIAAITQEDKSLVQILPITLGLILIIKIANNQIQAKIVGKECLLLFQNCKVELKMFKKVMKIQAHQIMSKLMILLR